jgi:biotin carboxylase
MKKFMQLGANAFQTSVIKAAKDLGCYVITVDYLPSNPGHKYSDEYHNISTVDKEGVLKLAEELSIDGISAYASDVSACTAAYVAENLGLPGNPYRSVEIMTHKNLTRAFLGENGFNVPKNGCFTDPDEALAFYEDLACTVMVKPVDSAGSKGVSKIYSDNADSFYKSFLYAKEHSLEGKVIVEEFVQRSGFQIAGDSFLVNGKVVFSAFMDEHFDNRTNPLVPIGESYPSCRDSETLKIAQNEIQRYMDLLDMKTGAINMDFLINDKNQVYIIEIGPRSGGNLISDIVYESSGINLAQQVVLAAIGETPSFVPGKPGTPVASYIIHASSDGVYDKTVFNDTFKKDVLKYIEIARSGSSVKGFENAGEGLGAILFKSSDVNLMNHRMENMSDFLRVNLIL